MGLYRTPGWLVDLEWRHGIRYCVESRRDDLLCDRLDERGLSDESSGRNEGDLLRGTDCDLLSEVDLGYDY